MEFLQILTRQEGAIEWITFNRPERLNAISRRMADEVIAALDEAERDPSVRVIILKGAGRAFCAGMDLKEYPIGGGIGQDMGFSGLWDKIEHVEKPVIAAIHGYAVTGGFLLAYCSDLVVAAEGTKMGDTHARLGLVPSGAETQRLPRKVGMMRAKELMFTSELIDAKEAERIGLVTRVVPPEQLDEAAMELAQKIAANSPKSVRFLKKLINQGMEVDFATGARMEAIANRWGTMNAEPDEDRDARLKRFRGA